MIDVAAELDGLFAPPPASSLSPEVLGELQSILRLHGLSAQELSYKWESYTMKMGSESTALNFENVRAFKKDLQEMLERESRGKAGRSVDRKIHATPRGGGIGDDVFGLCGTLAPSSVGGTDLDEGLTARCPQHHCSIAQ